MEIPFSHWGSVQRLGLTGDHGHFAALRTRDRPPQLGLLRSLPRSARGGFDGEARKNYGRNPAETRCLALRRTAITSERLLSPPSRRYGCLLAQAARRRPFIVGRPLLRPHHSQKSDTQCRSALHDIGVIAHDPWDFPQNRPLTGLSSTLRGSANLDLPRGVKLGRGRFAGFSQPTLTPAGGCHTHSTRSGRGLERATGIEPASSPWKREVLPLNDARVQRDQA